MQKAQSARVVCSTHQTYESLLALDGSHVGVYDKNIYFECIMIMSGRPFDIISSGIEELYLINVAATRDTKSLCHFSGRFMMRIISDGKILAKAREVCTKWNKLGSSE